MPASVPIVDRLDRADLGLVLAASTCDRIALLGGRRDCRPRRQGQVAFRSLSGRSWAVARPYRADAPTRPPRGHSRPTARDPAADLPQTDWSRKLSERHRLHMRCFPKEERSVGTTFRIWLLVGSLAAPAWAQAQRGTLEGVVKDAAGLVLPGAEVDARFDLTSRTVLTGLVHGSRALGEPRSTSWPS